MGEQDDDLVEGWKEIAAVTGLAVRTAQRQAQRGGLPAKHDITGVYASRGELERWVSERGTAAPPAPRAGYVYAFLDREGVVRYVGQTSLTIAERVGQHVTASGKPTRNAFLWWLAWYQDCYRRPPRVVELEHVADGAALDERERFWIQKHAATVFNFSHMPKEARL
jgi:hypothetical protein